MLQTRALPLGYVAIFHGPDETLYFSSKHDFNKAPRFRQEIFSFISFILNFIFLSIFYLFFYMLNLQLPCRSTLFFIFVFFILSFLSKNKNINAGKWNESTEKSENNENIKFKVNKNMKLIIFFLIVALNFLL